MTNKFANPDLEERMIFGKQNILERGINCTQEISSSLGDDACEDVINKYQFRTMMNICIENCNVASVLGEIRKDGHISRKGLHEQIISYVENAMQNDYVVINDYPLILENINHINGLLRKYIE